MEKLKIKAKISESTIREYCIKYRELYPLNLEEMLNISNDRAEKIFHNYRKKTGDTCLNGISSDNFYFYLYGKILHRSIDIESLESDDND